MPAFAAEFGNIAQFACAEVELVALPLLVDLIFEQEEVVAVRAFAALVCCNFGGNMSAVVSFESNPAHKVAA